jgi:hypothetical protein
MNKHWVRRGRNGMVEDGAGMKQAIGIEHVVAISRSSTVASNPDEVEGTSPRPGTHGGDGDRD